MLRIRTFRILTIICLFIALTAGNLPAAPPEEKPEAIAMILDVPVRILGIGLLTAGTAFFIVALPFALTSGSTGNAFDALIAEPFHFSFTRPLGQFDGWNSEAEVSDSTN